jgi:hypothetical protein
VRYYVLAAIALFLFTFEALRHPLERTTAIMGLVSVGLAGKGWISERLRSQRAVTGAREVWLREEIARLAGVIGAPANEVVGFEPSIDLGTPYIEVQPSGSYHWIVKERGQVLEHRTTEDVDDVLFWSFESTTSSMASNWAAHHSSGEEDFRISMWRRQQELLAELSPAWVVRWRQRLIRSVPEAANLLPSGAG